MALNEGALGSKSGCAPPGSRGEHPPWIVEDRYGWLWLYVAVESTSENMKGLRGKMRQVSSPMSPTKALRFWSLLFLLVALFPVAFFTPHLLYDKQQVADLPQLADGQGLYDDCVPGTSDCLNHLQQMASAGFKLVVNYDQFYGTAKDELAYADKAQALGMKIIWAMNDSAFWHGNARQRFAQLAATCNCSDNAGFIRYVVNLVKNHPATWGYYIGDEVHSSQHARVKVLTDLVKQTDPSHLRLFIGASAFPSGVAAALSPFADTADVLGTDYYPVGRTDIPHAINATAAIAKAIQTLDDQNGKQAAIVLQAISLGFYSEFRYLCSPFPSCMPYPTIAQMQLMRKLALQNAHPRLLLWYSYFDILKADNPSLRWRNLVTAAGA